MKAVLKKKEILRWELFVKQVGFKPEERMRDMDGKG